MSKWFGPIFVKIDHTSQTATLKVRKAGKTYPKHVLEIWRKQARAAVPEGYTVEWEDYLWA